MSFPLYWIKIHMTPVKSFEKMKAKPSTAQTAPLPSTAFDSMNSAEKDSLVTHAPAKLTSNWFKTVFVTWINPLLKLGSRRPLDILDLCAVPDCMVADPLTQKLVNSYDKKAKEAKEKVQGKETSSPSSSPTASSSFLMNAMISVFGPHFVLAGAFLLSELIYLMPIYVLTDVVEFRGSNKVPNLYAWFCDAKNFIWFGPLFMFFLQVFSTILLNTYFLTIRYLGIRVRTAVSGLIYRKSLRLSCSARQVSLNRDLIFDFSSFSVELFFW